MGGQLNESRIRRQKVYIAAIKAICPVRFAPFFFFFFFFFFLWGRTGGFFKNFFFLFPQVFFFFLSSSLFFFFFFFFFFSLPANRLTFPKLFLPCSPRVFFFETPFPMGNFLTNQIKSFFNFMPFFFFLPFFFPPLFPLFFFFFF